MSRPAAAAAAAAAAGAALREPVRAPAPAPAPAPALSVVDAEAMYRAACAAFYQASKSSDLRDLNTASGVLGAARARAEESGVESVVMDEALREAFSR